MASGSNAQPDAQIPPSLPDDVEQEESSSATDDEDVEEIMFAQKKISWYLIDSLHLCCSFPPSTCSSLTWQEEDKEEGQMVKAKEEVKETEVKNEEVKTEAEGKEESKDTGLWLMGTINFVGLEMCS